MKKTVIVLLTIFILSGCNKKRDGNMFESKSQNIDTLLFNADNYKKDKKYRIAYADSVANFLKDKDNDSVIRQYYFRLSDSYYSLQENEKNVATCRYVYKMCLSSQDTVGIAKSLYYIGDYHYSKFDNDSAYYYYTKAEKTYLSHNKNEDVVRLQFNKANILFFEKDFLGCEIAVIKILKIAKQNKNTRLIHDCYITLGNALDGLNDTPKAQEYYNKAFEMTSQLKDDPQFLILRGQAYNYIGMVYQKQKMYTQAESYFKKALTFDNFKNNNPYLYASMINNLAYSNLKLGNKSSLKQFKEALEISDSINSITGIVSSKINLSEYYLAQNDTARAIQYSSEALQTAHDNKIFEDELKTLQLLAKIDTRNAASHNNRFIKLTDSLQNNERATRNKYARIEFETEEILTQKNTIETEKNKISYQRWVILGFSVFTLVVMALLYLARIQRAKNKELQLEQETQKANEEIYRLMLDQQTKINEGRVIEKKRIAQELHDGIMSKLTSTRLNLFILSRRTDEETIKKCLTHIENIQNIEKEIRAISHDLSKDIFAAKDSFKMIIEALFEEQNNITSTHFELEIEDTIAWDVIENATKMHLYRIFQESIQNINKYAKAKKAKASINLIEQNIHVAIVDDGVGFEIQKNKEGIGLKNMRTRIESISGTINITSNKGEGTKINLIIPI